MCACEPGFTCARCRAEDERFDDVTLAPDDEPDRESDADAA